MLILLLKRFVPLLSSELSGYTKTARGRTLKCNQGVTLVKPNLRLLYIRQNFYEKSAQHSTRKIRLAVIACVFHNIYDVFLS